MRIIKRVIIQQRKNDRSLINVRKFVLINPLIAYKIAVSLLQISMQT